SEVHQALRDRVFAWASGYAGLFATIQQVAARSEFSTVFSIVCSPKDATVDHRLVAAQFLILFSLLDDLPDDAFEALARSVSDLTPATEVAPCPDEKQRCYRDFLRDLARNAPLRTEEFQRDFNDLCDGIRKKRRVDKRAMTEADYLDIRVATVAIKP